ncbi:hypothetical protein D6219_03410 [Coxiella burnetii]|nr:hypothetical protein D6219_03410 [Coxiella burnetii]PNT82495.1 hypothetical protein C2L93_10745 [Coxiella burnetii]
MDLLLFLKIEILCWRIMTPSLRGGSISLGYLAKSIFYWEQYDSKPVLIFFRSSRHRNMK